MPCSAVTRTISTPDPSENFPNIPNALGVRYTYWGLGCIDPDTYEKAKVAERIEQDIPVNYSALFAPAIQPTLDAGTKALCRSIARLACSIVKPNVLRLTIENRSPVAITSSHWRSQIDPVVHNGAPPQTTFVSTREVDGFEHRLRSARVEMSGGVE
jgi:hypothetical protein